MSANDPVQDPTPPKDQIARAFAVAKGPTRSQDFNWLVDFLNTTDQNTDPYGRLLQFSVYGNPVTTVYTVVQVQASLFGVLAQKVIDADYRLPFRIHVLSSHYGSPKSIGVCITWGPGGGW
jgi:hypothetical protein